MLQLEDLHRLQLLRVVFLGARLKENPAQQIQPIVTSYPPPAGPVVLKDLHSNQTEARGLSDLIQLAQPLVMFYTVAVKDKCQQ